MVVPIAFTMAAKISLRTLPLFLKLRRVLSVVPTRPAKSVWPIWLVSRKACMRRAANGLEIVETGTGRPRTFASKVVVLCTGNSHRTGRPFSGSRVTADKDAIENSEFVCPGNVVARREPSNASRLLVKQSTLRVAFVLGGVIPSRSHLVGCHEPCRIYSGMVQNGDRCARVSRP